LSCKEVTKSSDAAQDPFTLTIPALMLGSSYASLIVPIF